MTYQYPNEAAIEREAELRMDRFDEQVLSGKISTAAYERLCDGLDAWVKAQYVGLRSAA